MPTDYPHLKKHAKIKNISQTCVLQALREENSKPNKYFGSNGGKIVSDLATSSWFLSLLTESCAIY